jgi:hypothetical protein
MPRSKCTAAPARLRSVLAALALSVCLPSNAAEPARDGEKRWGQRLITEVAVPDAVVRRYAAHKRSSPDPREAPIVNALLAETVDWEGPSVAVDANANPHHTVLVVRGRARKDGDVSAMFHAGWEVEERTGGPARISRAVAGLARSDVKAGAPIELRAAAPPVSFRESRASPLLIAFAWSSNLVMLGLAFWWWRR